MAWTPERRAEAAERMRKIQANRKGLPTGSPFGSFEQPSVNVAVEEPTAIVEPVAPTPEEVPSVEEAPVVPVAVLVPTARARTMEYLVRITNGMQMVSRLGPCWCGVGKNKWHEKH